MWFRFETKAGFQSEVQMSWNNGRLTFGISWLTALSWKLLNLFPENISYVENFSVPGSDGESGLEIDY